MTNYQSLLIALIAVLQILLVSCSCAEENFWLFAAGVITLCLLAFLGATLCG